MKFTSSGICQTWFFSKKKMIVKSATRGLYIKESIQEINKFTVVLPQTLERKESGSLH